MNNDKQIPAKEIIDLTASVEKKGEKRKREASHKPDEIVDLTAIASPLMKAATAKKQKKSAAVPMKNDVVKETETVMTAATKEIAPRKKKAAAKKKKASVGPEKGPAVAVQQNISVAQRICEVRTPPNAHPLWVALLKKYSTENDPEYRLVYLEDKAAMDDWRRIISRDIGLVVCPNYNGGTSDQLSFLAEFESLCFSLTVPFVKAPLDVFTPFVKEISDSLGTIDTSRLMSICLIKVREADSYQLERIQNIVLADLLRYRAITPALTKVMPEIRILDKITSADASLKNNDNRQSVLVLGIENVRNWVMHGRPYLVLAMRPQRTPKNPLVPILRRCVDKEIPFVLYQKHRPFKKLLELESNEIIACIIDGPPRYATIIQSLVKEIEKAPALQIRRLEGDKTNLGSSALGQQTIPEHTLPPVVQIGINAIRKANDDVRPPIPEKIDLVETASEIGSTAGRSHTMTQTDESTVGLLESEIEALRLEERIFLLEAMLKNIANRRKLLQQEQDTAVSDLREKEDRVVQLVGKKKELALTLGRKRKLQKQMSKLLTKAEHRLQTLTTAVDISLDELAEFVGSESTPSVNRDASKTFSYSSTSSVQEARNAIERHRSGHTLHLAGVTLDRLRTLWVSKRDPRYRLATFGSVLSSKDKIKTFLHINAMETLAVDKVTNGWRWRRESMWNTCLDARLIISEPWHAEDMSLDNDYAEDSSGKSSNDRIDPYIPICPYEISGECQDEFCAYQHLQHRSFGRILPREFLPLPHLLLTLIEEDEEEMQHPEIESSKKESYRQETQPKSSMPAAQETSEEDFIRLPEVLLSCSDTANSGFEDYALLPVLKKYSTVNKADKAWLSRKQLEKTTKDNVSFKTLLESGFFYLDEQQESIFIELEPVKTPVEIFLFLIRLCKLVRLSIHAGRFDVSRAVLDFASDWSEKIEKDNTSLGEINAKLSCLIVRILNTLELKAFGLETESADSVFDVAYRTQEHLAIICCFLEFMLPRLGDESTANFFRTLTEQESALADIGHVDGDRPQDRLSSYFLPRLMEDDTRNNGEQCLEFLPDFICHLGKARQLRRDVLAIKSPSKIVADVIRPSLRWFEHFVERSLRLGQSTKEVLLKGVMLISQLVKGAIETIAIQLQKDSHIENVRNQMIDIWVAVDKLLFSIQKSCSFFPSLEFLLSPILAANVALGTTLCAYDRVIVRLEKFLGGHVPSPLSILSEILWSQLLQLEASLPKRTDRIVSVKGVYQLPLDVEELHELLALLITSVGVRPHHVTLANDWNLTSVFMNEPSEENEKLFQRIHERLVEDNLPQIEFKMSDRKLVNQLSRGPSAGVVSPIPFSLLVIGTSLSKLSLTRTGLKLLPDQFGVYFSCLESLDLSENDLEEIPQSTFLIKTLKSMRVSRNNLALLPNTVDLPVLSLFDAEDNKLRELPASFLYCTELERLRLRGNPLEKSVWTLAAQLPKLFEFTST